MKIYRLRATTDESNRVSASHFFNKKSEKKIKGEKYCPFTFTIYFNKVVYNHGKHLYMDEKHFSHFFFPLQIGITYTYKSCGL